MDLVFEYRNWIKNRIINFLDDVTFLVSVSGAGKTQILNTVEYSLDLAVRDDIILKRYDVSMAICVDGIDDTYLNLINRWEYEGKI